MSMEFLLIVPKNSNGIDSYNRGVNDETNQELFSLTRNEYEVLRRHHVFDILNDRFDLWIDEGESETITAQQLKEIHSSIILSKGSWQAAVDQAIEYNTCVYLVF